MKNSYLPLSVFLGMPILIIIGEFVEYPKWLQYSLIGVWTIWMIIAILSFLYQIYADIRSSHDPLWEIKKRIKNTKDSLKFPD